MSSLSNTSYNSRSMNGLINVNANTGTFTDLEVNNLIVNQSGTAPTMPTNDNSDHIATTAFVQSHTSGNYVDLTGTQTISGQKTFTNANTYVTGNLVTNSIQADAPTNNINIGTQLTTGNLNIGGATTNTTLNGTNTINVIKGKYLDLFAGQLRMFSGSGGGSAISLYVPPSGRTIMDFSTTNCDMVGQYNLTSNNITCSIAPTTSNEYCNKTYVDSYVSKNNVWTGTNTFNVSLPTSTLTPTLNSQLTTKVYVDNAISSGLSGYMNLTTAQTANGDKTFNGVTTFDNAVIANFQITNNDIASFQNGAFFDNVCPYSTVVATGSQDLVTKGFTETSTQTITGAKTFNNFAVNQTTGDVNITLNSSTQKVNIVRGTNTINMGLSGFPFINSNSNVASFQISAGTGATQGGFTINPSAGLGEGTEIDFSSTLYSAKNLWIDGSTGGMKSFGTNNIRIYNPFSYSYNPSTITWGSPSPNTINGWTNSPTNVGTTYTGTASDTTTPANVGQIVLPAPGIWFLQVSALITLNTGSDTITNRTIVVSDVGTTDDTPCTVGFKYADPIDDGAGSAGSRQIINFSGIYHFVDVSSGTRTLYINAIVQTSGTRTVTVSGNYKYTRMG